MWCRSLCVYLILIFECYPAEGLLLILPEDVATGFAAIYGFSPGFLKGNDHRVGFGFRFGNHADLQIMYELGPQITTKPLQPSLRVRSAPYRERNVRRPIIEFFIRSGLLRKTKYESEFNDNECNEPR